jgi:4a-hydroxytetrahydrobiopterin dehydratase
MTALRDRNCRPREGESALDRDAAASYLADTPGWTLNDAGTAISRTFRFGNYHETISFVNAVAYLVNRQDHHPDLEVGYNRCTVRFSTHSVKGLSENDFICAARINALIDAG